MRSQTLCIGISGILALALLALSAYTFMFAGRVQSVDRSTTEYPYIDPSRDFIGQENYIVNTQPLRQRLRGLADEFGIGSVSIYVEFLNTGANISINPDNYIWPASLAKVPLAMAVMKKIERGDWKLTNELVLLQGDANSESGDTNNPLSEYPIGTRFTIETLLKELLVNSDNTAFYILQRNLGDDEIREVVDDLGLEALFSDEGRVSAKEYSRLFRSLYTASFLTREHSGIILQWLDESPFNDFLTKPVPPEVPFPHKYGEKITTNTYSDSGVVYIKDRPYLITVMVQGDGHAPYEGERERAARFMQAVSGAAYEYFSTQRR